MLQPLPPFSYGNSQRTGSENVMADKLQYVIWYHKLFGKTKKGRDALKFYGSYEDMYKAITSGNDETGIVSSAPVGKYLSYSLIDAEKVIETCEKNGWHIIPSASEDYPSELLEINDYPHLLFADGKKEILTKNVKFAVVGSRAAKDEAEVIAYNSAYNLASTGAVIVSGAAVGIDSAAHLGAVKSGGATIGVLGCGLGHSYMKKISEFYDEIKQSGVYVSELMPFEKNTMSSFPDRNRIISGMSRAVLVVCAAKESGTLNTVAHAKKQKRSIFVSAPEICYSEGCQMLLDEGAYAFYNAGDMAYPNWSRYKEGSFNALYCNKPVSAKLSTVKREDMALPKRGRKTEKTSQAENSLSSVTEENSPDITGNAVTKTPSAEKTETDALLLSVSETAADVYKSLGENTVHTEELSMSASYDVWDIQTAIGELEAFGLVRCLPGGYVEKI